VKRGADLSRQLLGFARRGKYVVEPLELRPVLELTSGMFGRTRTDVPIELEVAPGLRRVLMDQTQLEQVLMNLFVNAGQAMPDGGRLCLRADDTVLAKETAKLHSVEPGPFVRLIVADTGVGMDATTQARIFEPFFTTRGPGRGPGLGLAAVYGIVHSHGGFITVESQPKRGTSFTLFLPAVEAEVEGATREAQGSQPGFTLRSSSKLHRPTT
jgi:signal transduction histidine kinase